MENLALTDIKERVSLLSLLAHLGFRPVRSSGKELMFLSMLRDSDTKPSFAVNEELNVWYDHGMGKGGNVIDFGLAFWKGLTFREVLLKLQELSEIKCTELVKDDVRPRRRHALKLPHYKIEEVKELGTNYAITEYLMERGVWPVAQGRLKEIYYYVEDEKKLRKYFFAAGWQNEQGAWEVRNKYFKGSLGHKGITFMSGSKESLAVFEGYFNYLSWIRLNPDADDAVIVLNSISLLQAAIKPAGGYRQVSLYLDRDQAGHQASVEFVKAVPCAKDRSAAYDGFNDYNDLLTAIIREPKKIEAPETIKFSMRR